MSVYKTTIQKPVYSTALTELFLTGAAMLRGLRIDNADEVDDYADAVFVHKGPN